MTKIMIVEDDFDNRVLLAECLSLENYEVMTAENGKVAIDMLDENSLPDLLLMDLSFPKGSALEFINQFRKIAKNFNIPIIVLSGRPDIKKQSAELCAAHFLQKPYDLNQLLDNIAEAVAANASQYEKIAS